MIKVDFSKKLLKWDGSLNSRQMPWKAEKDPYRIWLSEIILQQTRVEQGIGYYKRFIEAFPDIRDLARAPENKIFKIWEGLGYYSRCRNLIATSKKIVKEYNGRFPATYEEILDLKGIGPYTAAAISSFAFNLPYAVLDGNVQRVLARYFGISTTLKGAAEKNLYSSLANSLLDKNNPGMYNQAIMDFGAVICKPRNPLCSSCVQSKHCEAFQHGWTNSLPVKKKAPERKIRWVYYFIIESEDGNLYIRKRTAKDIWENLYEFVLWETGKLLPQKEWEQSGFMKNLLGNKKYKIGNISGIYKQQLSHQIIYGSFVHIHMQKGFKGIPGYQEVSRKKINSYPFPRIISTHLPHLLPPV